MTLRQRLPGQAEIQMIRLFSRAAAAMLILLMVGCSGIGKTLYLARNITPDQSVKTKRAVFEYSADCELVAKHMNAAEPRADWYCQ